MTAQKVPEKGSAESFLVSPGFLAAAQVVDLDNAETPHQEPPESSFKAKSRKREGEDSLKRAHSVTMDELKPEVDEITPATKTQRKPITARSAITTAKATGAPKAKVVKERASKSTKTTYRPPHVFTAMACHSVTICPAA
ncbi:hypothetical protein FIBSPDRAFT_948401 [Athelia psychrophila]|uniref:Uncharacterized protein n=1 Tax=Athelia psychrophila TaxID=1759441 RepID=A0A166QRS8_9AGAM|nr:hypothetical protein FIBSPDRAFT_948401 [Fibularhizoctonia sp. CBS 109695]